MVLSAAGDACVAMDEWVQNPKPHTALDDILPCRDNAAAQEAALCTKGCNLPPCYFVSFSSLVISVFIANTSNIIMLNFNKSLSLSASYRKYFQF